MNSIQRNPITTNTPKAKPASAPKAKTSSAPSRGASRGASQVLTAKPKKSTRTQTLPPEVLALNNTQSQVLAATQSKMGPNKAAAKPIPRGGFGTGAALRSIQQGNKVARPPAGASPQEIEKFRKDTLNERISTGKLQISALEKDVKGASARKVEADAREKQAESALAQARIEDKEARESGDRLQAFKASTKLSLARQDERFATLNAIGSHHGVKKANAFLRLENARLNANTRDLEFRNRKPAGPAGLGGS